jgi:integrase
MFELQNLLSLYLSSGDWSEAARTQYTWMLRRHVEFLGPEMDVRAVKPLHLQAWYAAMKEGEEVSQKEDEQEEQKAEAKEGKEDEEERQLSIATLSLRARCVKAFWLWVTEQAELDKCPFKVKYPTYKPDPLRNKAIDPADRDAMLAEAKSHSARDYAILRFLTDTACRAEGLCMLTFEQLDLDDYRAAVCKKGDHKRTYTAFFDEETAKAIRAYLPERKPGEHDYVFTSTRTPYPCLNDNSLYRILSRTAKRAGVEVNFNTHAWRHEAAQRMAKKHYPLTLIQAKLDHSSPEVTALYYLNQDDEALRRATKELSPPAPDIPEDEEDKA